MTWWLAVVLDDVAPLDLSSQLEYFACKYSPHTTNTLPLLPTTPKVLMSSTSPQDII